MRIAKPTLLVSTPIGVAGGLLEGFRLAGGLALDCGSFSSPGSASDAERYRPALAISAFA
jgi:hypothetical protein